MVPGRVEGSDGWAGWPDIPTPAAVAGWVDLTHRFGPELPHGPKVERLMSQPQDLMNLTRVEMMVHCGTHLDAPNHFIPGAPGIDEIPLERLWGPGVVWSIDVADEGVIDAVDLEKSSPGLERGDIVILATGFAASIRDERYRHHPSLSPAAAQWLVDAGAKLVAIDFLAPEPAIHLRPEGYDFPVHRILLGNGVLIIENAGDARPLAGQRVDVRVVPIPIAGSDGSPIRLLARALHRTPQGA
jgi:kynurenine formamidase